MLVDSFTVLIFMYWSLLNLLKTVTHFKTYTVFIFCVGYCTCHVHTNATSHRFYHLETTRKGERERERLRYLWNLYYTWLPGFYGFTGYTCLWILIINKSLTNYETSFLYPLFKKSAIPKNCLLVIDFKH